MFNWHLLTKFLHRKLIKSPLLVGKVLYGWCELFWSVCLWLHLLFSLFVSQIWNWNLFLCGCGNLGSLWKFVWKVVRIIGSGGWIRSFPVMRSNYPGREKSCLSFRVEGRSKKKSEASNHFTKWKKYQLNTDFEKKRDNLCGCCSMEKRTLWKKMDSYWSKTMPII